MEKSYYKWRHGISNKNFRIIGLPAHNLNKDLIIRKGFRHEIASYSAFFENDQSTPTGLEGYLKTRDIKTIYLCGLALDFCVYFSALDGVKLGFKVFVIQDACKAIALEGSLALSLDEMNSKGVNLISSSDLLS